MRRMLFLGILFLFVFGCLSKPYSEGANVTQKTGCDYDAPSCESNSTCINNTCILRSGCDYGNPACSSNETCTNNTCISKTGCAYSNPACGSDYECSGNSCVDKTVCGKFGCQAGESSNCCLDCGCDENFTCSDSGICVASDASLAITNVLVNNIPSTVLYAVSPGQIDKALGPLAQVTIVNKGSAKAYVVKLKTEVQGFTGIVVNELGTLEPGQNYVFNYTPRLSEDALSIQNRTDTWLKLALEYSDAGKSQSSKMDVNISLSDRNEFDWNLPEAASGWMDPKDQGVANFATDAIAGQTPKLDGDRMTAARQIYNHLQAMGMKNTMKYGKCYSDSLAFPAQTLELQSGNCADISVLYATLLEAVGIKSVIIVTDDAVLSGFKLSNGTLVPVDLQRIDDDDFANATASGLSLYSSANTIFYPQEQWSKGTAKSNPGIETFGPKITTTSEKCMLLSKEFSVSYWFENTGYQTGRRCLKAVLYKVGQEEYLSNRVCVDVPAYEKRNITFSYNLSGNMALTEKCFID